MFLTVLLSPDEILINQLRTLWTHSVPIIPLAAVLYLVRTALRTLRSSMSDPRPAGGTAKTVRRVLAGTIVFLYYLWPTPWLYSALGGTSYRFNVLTRQVQARFGDGVWRNGGVCGRPFLN